MKNTFTHLLIFGVICLFLIGCQTVAPIQKISATMPTPAKPTPAWTKKFDQAKSDQQILITTKLIEITRPVGSADIPTKRYEKKLNDAQFQMYARELAQKKGTDIMSAPSVVTKDGQAGSIELTREFVYPVEPDFTEIENVGVTSHIKAHHLGNKDIPIKIFTRVCEFDGFSEVNPEIPVFVRRDIEASTQLRSGETIVIGGLVDEFSQEIEDKGPLGIIKKRFTQKFSRELIIAVSASLINPDGSPQ